MIDRAKQALWAAALTLVASAFALPAGSAQAQSKRVTLQVLVISADDVGTAAFKAGLDEGLVPYTEVKLAQAGRPLINDAFLADPATFASPRRAKFQAVVLPNEAPAGLSAAERDALRAFEREFKIRQLDAYVYPSPAVFLNWPQNPGYIGAFDGLTAQVSAAGRSAGFSYLNGPVPFEDLSPSISESYGALALPLASDPVTRRSFSPLVELPIPGSASSGVVVGVFNDDGREEMVLTVAVNAFQLAQQVLFPGMLEWLTYGTHLGAERSYLSVHIDDVFLSDSRWSADLNCTVEDAGCAATDPDVLMTAADVDYLVAWQQRQGLKLDLVYNGAGYDEAIAAAGAYPLGARLLAQKSQFRWVNHTYTHAYLGCVQDLTVNPFRCRTDAAGKIMWASFQTLYDEINNNISFAGRNGLAIVRGELVTGEHSGLRRAPQEPSDNPNLAGALDWLGIGYLGSDSSREHDPRVIGRNTLTVPRYPMNIYYNTGKKTEAADEYNWLYTAASAGGGGICENNPSSSCIPPLDTATGFDSYIVPQEARATLLHAVANDPRPHYAHQSNLAEDRILYPVLDKAIADYRNIFASSAALVNPTLTQAGDELKNRTAWKSGRASTTAYVEAGRVYLRGTALLSSTNVPFTAPAGSTGGGLSSYAGKQTGWTAVSAVGTQIALPATVLLGR
jgi:hypothetical protein